MKLRLTRPATRQLDTVLAYIDQHSPQGSRTIQPRIQEIMHILMRHPHAGHVMSRAGIRRMVVSPYRVNMKTDPTFRG